MIDRKNRWYIFSFTLPKKTPSRIRVSIWRRLKKEGALNVSMGNWILPLKTESLTFFSNLHQEIIETSGTAFLMEASYIPESDNDIITKAFNAERENEYEEFLEKCRIILEEIEEETKAKEFTFTELKDNDSMAQRMDEWFKRISSRDFFTSPMQSQAINAWQSCKASMQAFENKVYHHNKA